MLHSGDLELTVDHAPEKGEDFSVIAKDFQDKILPGKSGKEICRLDTCGRLLENT